jgi:hypothetical protein
MIAISMREGIEWKAWIIERALDLNSHRPKNPSAFMIGIRR